MENKENLSINSSVKPNTAKPSQKTATHTDTPKNGSVEEGHKKKGSKSPKRAGGKEPPKTELTVKTEESGSHRRPNTASGGLKKKSESLEKERNVPASKSASGPPKNSERKPAGGSRSASPTQKEKKPPSTKVKPTQKIEPLVPLKSLVSINYEFTSLLPQAVQEQKVIIEMLRTVREELIRKMTEKLKPKSTSNIGSASSAPCLTGCFHTAQPSSTDFENSYSGILEEIFQAWVNLFYFILNLTTNLVRMMAGTEPFRPNIEKEREIVEQAIECVKFFSKLKMKSLVNSLDELQVLDEPNISEIQIRLYEEQISSPFLFGMDFIQKKAKEILEQNKK